MKRILVHRNVLICDVVCNIRMAAVLLIPWGCLALASLSWLPASSFAADTAANAKGTAAAPAKPLERPTEKPTDRSNAKPKPATNKLTVAVLDFAATDLSNPNLGAEVGAELTAVLASENGFSLVDRQSLTNTLREQKLNLTGLATPDQTVKIGKLVGAKILVTGRLISSGKDLYVTAKIVGTETSLLAGVLMKVDKSTDTGNLVMQLAEKVSAKIRDSGAEIAATPLELDPVPELKKSLAARRKPSVAVIISERHQPLASNKPAGTAASAATGAAETAVKRLLVECGFEVVELPPEDRASLGKTWNAADVAHWPAKLEKVEYLVTGAGFSELAARLGDIVSCSARIDASVIRRADGKLLLAESAGARAADLSEAMAAKKALQAAGRSEGIAILEKFDTTLAR